MKRTAWEWLTCVLGASATLTVAFDVWIWSAR